MRADRRRRAVAGGVGGPEGDLDRGLRAQVLVVGRRGRDRRRVERRRLERVAAPGPRREQHDVVRVHEAGDEQERAERVGVAGPAAGVAVLAARPPPGRDERVAAGAGVGQPGAVRLGPDPAGEPVRVERVGVEVGLHRRGVDHTVVVVGGERRAGRRVEQVGVADVPLALVVGVVAAGPEPVAERRHLALAQPAHAGVVGHLAEPVGLGDAVDVGVLAGEQRRPAGHAGERAGVVAAEGDAVLVEPAAAGQRVVAPAPQVVALVGRGGPLLVGEDDDDIGPHG